MTLGEFQLIDRYFRPMDRPGGTSRPDVLVGVGDDGAVLRVPEGRDLVAVLDTLVEGRHFLPGCSAHSIGHRALAVNLSDLAAMGATPAWALLGLTLPVADALLLQGIAEGMGALAARYGVALVGGDTTAGPLSLTVQAMGFVPRGQALRRSGGAVGDLLCISGTPGDAAAGLLLERGAAGGVMPAPELQAAAQVLRDRFLYPTPRVSLGEALRELASACIDVSDGLAQDAGKLAQASGCGLRLQLDRLPLSTPLLALMGRERAVDLALTGGDDYELCFTLPPGALAQLSAVAADQQCPLTCIGVLEAEPGLRLYQDGAAVHRPMAGFDHFTGAG